MKFKLFLIAILFSHFLFGQKEIQRIDSLFNSFREHGQFNGNVLITEKGKPIYQKSFGLANEESKEELNEKSVSELASCAKQFTALAIVQLKEQGKLNYDDTIDKHLPELREYHKVTVRHLLNHTSGMPDYMQLMDSLWDKAKIATNQDIIYLFEAYRPPLLFEPNTKFEYCNTGYTLLASIIEKLSGLSYGTYLEKKYFTPLKMSNTFIFYRRYAPKRVISDASGYVYDFSSNRFVLAKNCDHNSNKIVIWLNGIVGDGTINSTVSDLVKWDRALYQNTLITKESKKDLYVPATLMDGAKTKYGLGLFLINDNTFGYYASNTDGWPGYATFIERHITSDKVIIIHTNYDEIPRLLKALRHILYSDDTRKKNKN
jgi:CubicO group peptidase (beta-lactamase class C family)